MNFRPELAAKVMAGEKTVTRRIPSINPRSPWWIKGCKLVVGRDYAVCPGRGKPAIGRIVIERFSMVWLSQMTEHEARLEGFEDTGDFFDAWDEINPTKPGDTLVWRVQFKAIPGSKR